METPKKLFRSRKSRLLAGVCGGVAEYLNLDPTIIRLVWVLFSLLFGFGVLAYIVAWILIPSNPM
jgi:phage shock protein C